MSEYDFYAPEYAPVASGFHNTGAICWFNSLFQSLLSCTSLNRQAVAAGTPARVQDTPSAPSGTALSTAQAAQTAPTAYTAYTAQPSALTSLARAYLDEYRRLSVAPDPMASTRLLGAMIASMRAAAAPTAHNTCVGTHAGAHAQAGAYAPMPMLSFGSSQECADEGFTYFIDNIGSLQSLFTVEYESWMQCACGGRTDPVRDRAYQIELYADYAFTKSQDFTDYIQNHAAPTDRQCECCGETMRHRHDLKRLRECIVLVFNKFYNKYPKWFPQELRFRALPRGSQLVYEQVAQIEHGGNMFGGHYWARVRRRGAWYTVNDSSVAPAAPGPTPETYMVVYHLVRHEPPARQRGR
jgi:hypothetical protein